MALRKFGASRDALRYEPSSRRVRALLGDAVVAESRAPSLVWPPGWHAAVYAVPSDDVTAELSPAAKARDGAAETWDVTAGGRTAPGAAWRYDDPDVGELVVLDIQAFAWFEEDEELRFFPQDPFHRVDIRASSRHVAVDLDGVRVAESTRPVLLFETNLPLRVYLPRDDVRMDLLATSPTRSRCPYKGEASYWSATVEGTEHRDVAWCYEQPTDESAKVRDLVAFWPGRAEVRVDGELVR